LAPDNFTTLAMSSNANGRPGRRSFYLNGKDSKAAALPQAPRPPGSAAELFS
jgi:hypothetical protein